MYTKHLNHALAIGRIADVGTNHAILYPDGSYTGTTYSGRSSTVTDPAGNVRTLMYDALGRLTLVTEDPGTSPHLNYQTNYTYGAFDNLLAVTQGSQTRNFAYDSLARLYTAQNPEVGIGSTQCLTTYGYDRNGNLTSKIAPLPNQNSSCNTTVTTTSTYDPLNRLTYKTYSDGTTPTANFFYDVAPSTMPAWSGVSFQNATGRLVLTCTGSAVGTCTGPQTATAHSYDPMGRTQDYWQCVPGSSCSSSVWQGHYHYTLAGDNDWWIHPAGWTITNTIPRARRITQISSSVSDSTHPAVLAQNIKYTAWGALSSLQNGYAGSGVNVQETYMYNKRQQPAVVELGTTSNHTVDYCLVYDYYGSLPTSCPTSPPTGTTGNNGNVRGYWYQDSVNTSSFPHTASYTYDGANRLLTATAKTLSGSTIWSQTYSPPDQWGNWTCSGSGVCPTLSWNAQNNHLLTIGGNNPLSFNYDAAGNMTYDPSNYSAHTYQWDAEGRVSKVDGGTTWSFTYNALGHRVGWASSGGGETHVFDPAGNWLGLGNAGGYTLVRFGQRFLVAYIGSETYFNHVNNLGSTSMFTNHAGAAAEDMLFYPWGNVWQSWGTGGYNFAYLPFRDTNANTDLTTARIISPNFGRWFSPDPAGKGVVKFDDPQTWNMYAYVRNNPATLTDPSGLSWWDWVLDAVQWISEAERAGAGQQNAIPSPTRKPPPPAPHVEYKQSTGDTSVKTGSLTVLPLGTGYAGHNEGLNNPANEGVEENYAHPDKSNAGPLPRGEYTIGPIGTYVTSNGTILQMSMRLTEVPGATDQVDRSGGYFIHGGNFNTMDSSQGCIVEPPAVRVTIGNSGINVLEVVR